MKFRFRTMNDGQIRRWHAGKRHNAHQKVPNLFLVLMFIFLILLGFQANDQDPCIAT
jgi:hypothetical protein